MTTQFGCAQCYGEDAETLSAFYHGPGTVADQIVVNHSHFIVSLFHCATCGQVFVSIFTEFVDWSGGDDAQYSDVVPVTSDEVATILAQGKRVDLRYLGSLGEGRRRLSTDWPTGGSKRIGWATGQFQVDEGY